MSNLQHISSLKESILNWTISIFIVLLIIASVFTNLFQNPEGNNNTLQTYIQLYSPKKLSSLIQVEIQNNRGNFTLTKLDSNKWAITSPRKLAAKYEMLTELVDGISQLNVKNLYQKDTINLTNFALNTPRFRLTLSLRSEGKIKNETISFGMKNPISNTNYIMLDSKDIIYQTSAFSFPVETLSFTDFIDSKIFGYPKSRIKSIKIIRYKKTFLDIHTTNNGQWYTGRKELPFDKVDRYIDRLLAVKSHIILDKITDAQKKRLKRYFTTPPIQINLVLKSGELKEFYATTLLQKFPNLNLKGELFFFIQEKESPNYQLVLKSDYSLLLKSFK